MSNSPLSTYKHPSILAFLVLCLFLVLQSPLMAGPKGELKQGYKALKMAKLDKALSHYQKAEKKWGSRAELAFYKAQVYYAKGEYRQALASYQQAQATLPKKHRPWLLNNMGNIYFQQKKYRQAIRYYSTALLLKPDYERARYNLELALAQQQKKQKPKKRKTPPKKQKPPPPRKKKKRPPKKQKKKKVKKKRKMGQVSLFLPESKSLKLAPFDQFLPYSRVLKFKKKKRKQ